MKISKIKAILCAVLSFCIITIPIVTTYTVSAEEDISSLEQQLQELEEKNKEYQALLEENQAEIEKKEEYIDALVKRIEVLDDKIEFTHKSISKLNDDIEQKKADIKKANDDIEGQLDALCDRLRTIYMAGTASDLEIIFGAKDFSDLIDKVQLVKTLSNYDKELIDTINLELEKISKQKEELEADKAELEVQEDALKADQAELNDVLAENEETLKTLYATKESLDEELEHAEFNSEEIENQIADYYAQKEAEKAQQNSQNSSSSNSNSSSNSGGINSTPIITGSGYAWPCPGFYYLSSQWNEDRYTYNHGAIDIAGGGIMGTPVVAADDGTVSASYSGCPHNWGKYGSCGCGGGYGNYIFLDHGNGKSTVYGHLSSLTVGYYQTVKKGQVIGYVGSTGHSTGPHLHFECRQNNVKYNPMLEY